MVVRTRFAPSPTGSLHIGGARTALFCWAFARHFGGQFILRIEDTDRERSTQASIDAILQSMAWLNLDYDEGPIYQTDRFERYYAMIDRLMSEGKAYRCTCSKARLDTLRAEQMAQGLKPRYDGHCRDSLITADAKDYVIRFRNPLSGEVVFDDCLHGQIRVDNRELDDLIIARSDGTPTYNFTVVVDDMDMQITHVIRGDDHINNTPRQINLMQAFGYDIPLFAHVPMILGPDGKRLSKRHGAASVMEYREQGILPHALLNYLIRLGWSYGDQEIFSRAEMINLFDLNGLNRSAASINPEKLLWLNQHYIKSDDAATLSQAVCQALPQLDQRCLEQGPPLTAVIDSLRTRSKTITELAQQARYFYLAPSAYDDKAVAKHINTSSVHLLEQMLKQLEHCDTWQQDQLSQCIKHLLTQLAIKMPLLAQPLRIALTGNTITPSIDLTLYLIGKKQTLTRLQNFIRYLQTNA